MKEHESSWINLDQYKNELEALVLSIAYAKQSQVGKRYIRRLHRRFILLASYIAIASPAIHIIKQYHSNPIIIVDKFWQTLDSYGMILHSTLPTIADFFEWYCSSATIREEYQQNYLPSKN